MNNQGHNATEKGWLSGFLGKAFAVTSVVSLSMALTGIGQHFDVLPGDSAAHSYVDLTPTTTRSVSDMGLGSPQLSQENQDKLLDSDVSFGEGAKALGVTLAAGVVGSAFASVSNNKWGIEVLNEAKEDRRYRNANRKYLKGFIEKYKETGEISLDDMGKLICMEERDLKKLPPKAYRDVDYVKLNIHQFNDVANYQSAPLFAPTLDAGLIHIGGEDDAGRPSILDGAIEPESADVTYSKNPSLLLAMSGAILCAVSSPLTIPTYFSGKSIYDNFVKDYPTLEKYKEPKFSELMSNTKAIEEAFEHFDKPIPVKMASQETYSPV